MRRIAGCLMSDINDLLASMKKADERTEDLKAEELKNKEEKKPLRPKLTPRQQYLRSLHGGRK